MNSSLEVPHVTTTGGSVFFPFLSLSLSLFFLNVFLSFTSSNPLLLKKTLRPRLAHVDAISFLAFLLLASIDLSRPSLPFFLSLFSPLHPFTLSIVSVRDLLKDLCPTTEQTMNYINFAFWGDADVSFEAHYRSRRLPGPQFIAWLNL